MHVVSVMLDEEEKIDRERIHDDLRVKTLQNLRDVKGIRVL